MNAIIANSAFAQQLYMSGRFYAFDIDDTLVRNPVSPSQLKAREVLREIARGSGEIFNTMRPVEETYSDRALESIGKNGLVRLKPHPNFPSVDRDFVEDPQLGLSIGLPPVWEQTDGSYMPDLDYRTRTHPQWRQNVLRLFRLIDPNGDLVFPYLHAVESESNYRTGKANILPVEHRFNFRFRGDDSGKEDYIRVQKLIKVGMRRFPRIDIEFVDESNPPLQLSFYMMHPNATKKASLEYNVYAACRTMGMRPSEVSSVRGIYAGDAMTDLNASLLACPDMDMASIVPAEARIAPYLFGERKGPFVTTPLDTYLDCLDDTDEIGIFRFRAPGANPRLLLMGGYLLTDPGSPTESVLECVQIIEKRWDLL